MKIMGISIRTTNQDGKAMIDLGHLWQRFIAENIEEQISDKVSNIIYCIYTDYESDYTGAYTALLGIEVTSLYALPPNLIAKEFAIQKFQKFTAHGLMPEAVAHIWNTIWSQDKELNRAYTYDYEVYGEQSQKGAQSEVEIYIAVK